MNIQTIKNVSDCVPLYLPHSLYLKPSAKFNVSVQLPTAITGKTISNWDVMENLRKMISPDKFSVLKVTKSTLEVIRFDAELEERARLKSVIARLEGNSIKLSGYSESARIRASEAKENFPKRHDWDSYFRDARNMDEKKPGERPDTIHISNLPIRWFCPRHQENEENVKPSESIFKRIFEKFGSVRMVDIPICDPFRKDMKSHMTGMKTFSFDQDLYFEGYVQFSEYLGFVKTMDEFRGMKLVRKDGDKNLAINITMDFDTTKHLSESSIKRRKIIRDRLIAKEQVRREEEMKRQQEEEAKKEKERQTLEQMKLDEYEKQRMREEKRKEKHLKKLREQEQNQLNSKIRSEERKLMIAQRKLESIRVLEALFERIKLKNSTLKTQFKGENDSVAAKSKVKESSGRLKSFDLRNKLISKVKTVQEQELERQKNRVKKCKAGSILGSALDHSKERSPSINSISSDDSILSDKSASKKKKRKKDTDSSDGREAVRKDEQMPQMLTAAGAYPVFNPDTGQWLNMGMGMYPYPAQFFPQPTHMMRPEFFQNAVMPYPFRGSNYRGRFPRSRGRGGYRSRGNYNSHGSHYDNGYDDYDSYDHKRRDYRKRSNSRTRSRSYSRSRSRSVSRSRRSRSRSRKRSRSRSHSRSHSNRNRNRRTRSTSQKSRSKLQTENKAKNLASTLRRSRSSSSASSSGRSSRSRHRSRRTRRERSEKRNRSERRESSQKRDKSEKRSETSDRRDCSERKDRSERSERREKSEKHDPERREMDKEEKKTSERKSRPRTKSRSPTKSRSKSIDSSKFQSPKRKECSTTPEKAWDKL